MPPYMHPASFSLQVLIKFKKIQVIQRIKKNLQKKYVWIVSAYE